MTSQKAQAGPRAQHALRRIDKVLVADLPWLDFRWAVLLGIKQNLREYPQHIREDDWEAIERYVRQSAGSAPEASPCLVLSEDDVYKLRNAVAGFPVYLTLDPPVAVQQCFATEGLLLALDVGVTHLAGWRLVQFALELLSEAEASEGVDVDDWPSASDE